MNLNVIFNYMLSILDFLTVSFEANDLFIQDISKNFEFEKESIGIAIKNKKTSS